MRPPDDPRDRGPALPRNDRDPGSDADADAPAGSGDAGSVAGPAGGAPGESRSVLPFDPWRIVLALGRRLLLILAAGLVLAVPAGIYGWMHFQTRSTATVQLIRRELSTSFRTSELGEAFRPRQFATATVISMMRNSSLLGRVGSQAKPPISSRELGRQLTITPEKNTDIITVTLETSARAEDAVNLLNAYAREVVALTQNLQADEAGEIDAFLREQLARADKELAEVNRELLEFTQQNRFYSADKEIEAYLREVGELDNQIENARIERDAIDLRLAATERELARQNPQAARVAEARGQLAALLIRYTDSHPDVVEQSNRVAALERDALAATNAVADFQFSGNTVANSLFLDLLNFRTLKQTLSRQVEQLATYREQVASKLQALPGKNQRFARLDSRRQALEMARSLLGGRQREAQLYAGNAPGYYRLFAPATVGQVTVDSATRKSILITLAAFLAGLALAALAVIAREILDDRLLSPSDAARATRAPVLARLPDLAGADPDDQRRWRFRTWSHLGRHLGPRAGAPLQLALTSAAPGEGRSTWIDQLRLAARERGLRTLSLTNAPAPLPADADAAAPAGPHVSHLPLADALADPRHVASLLETAEDSEVLLHWPPGTSWNLALRDRLRSALRLWSTIPNLALLAELPPADDLDAVLAAEAFPALLWVCACGLTRQPEVAELVATVRTADLPLAGCLVNRAPTIFERLPDLSRFGLLVPFLVALSLLAATPGSLAETTPPGPTAATPPAVGAGTLSAAAAGPRLAPWQQHLTLGAGDVVQLGIYGRKDLARTDVAVGPDGRLSYLEASDIKAAGLTIDELRARLEEALSQTRRNVRVTVRPSAWRSKKYYLLGTVMDRGAFPLDRPTTLIEAVARARGIATGLLEQNTVEIADLPRAFLVRANQRIPVDFVKLFQEGDLSQNLLLEPGDYIYFPSAAANEVYVLGAVAGSSTVGLTENSTVVGCITTRGGFTQRAYRRRVLLIRGSLNKPETIVVDVSAILAGKARDVPVQPRDIIYVADRPWADAEELLDTAIKAFIQGAAASWAGLYVPPAFTEPVIPGP